MQVTSSLLKPTQRQIYESVKSIHRQAFAERLLESWQPKDEPLTDQKHPSHITATQILEPFKTNLGAAYPTLHLLCRWSVENATEDDPAPHLMTTYWTLEEALGKDERTTRRHLIEDGHPWSETVKHLIDVRHNCGTMLDGKDNQGRDKTKGVYVATVIRFFPKGRLSKNARVKRWGYSDLIAESDSGRTRNSRLNLHEEKARYQRRSPLMSDYSSMEEKQHEFNWLMVKLGQSVSPRAEQIDNHGSLYADIPITYLLQALREDLVLGLESAQARGSNLKRTRSKWVDTSAKILAHRFGDDVPVERKSLHTSHWDGFTDLWRKALWTALRAETYGGTDRGWHLLERMIYFAHEARHEPIDKPTAWAWTTIKHEGFTELLRDFGSGAIGSISA